MRSFILTSLLFLIPGISFAAENIEVVCWNSGTDADGSFSCQYIFIGARIGGKYVYPDLQAPDDEGALTWEQADRACEYLGYGKAMRFELALPSKASLQGQLTSDGDLIFEISKMPFIQHLYCVN